MATKKQIYSTLTKYGIPMHIRGFEYLVSALDGCLNGTMDIYTTKAIYIDVAKMHDSTSSRVERSVRHAIIRAYEIVKEPNMLERFKEKPVNSEFIATLVYELKEN